MLRSAVCAVAAAGAVAAARAPLNLLFMMADQLRFDALGVAATSGNVSTPNLDALARSGVLFANAYSTTPTCTPARSAILTGLSPWYHGMLGYGNIADRYPFEMPRALAAGGYFTAHRGKNHFGWANGTGIPHGYESLMLYDGLGTGMPNDTKDEFDQYDQCVRGHRGASQRTPPPTRHIAAPIAQVVSDADPRRQPSAHRRSGLELVAR